MFEKMMILALTVIGTFGLLIAGNERADYTNFMGLLMFMFSCFFGAIYFKRIDKTNGSDRN